MNDHHRRARKNGASSTWQRFVITAFNPEHPHSKQSNVIFPPGKVSQRNWTLRDEEVIRQRLESTDFSAAAVFLVSRFSLPVQPRARIDYSRGNSYQGHLLPLSRERDNFQRASRCHFSFALFAAVENRRQAISSARSIPRPFLARFYTEKAHTLFPLSASFPCRPQQAARESISTGSRGPAAPRSA